MSVSRGPGVTAGLAVAFFAAAIWLPIAAALVVGATLALSGVLRFSRPAWRAGSLLVAAIMLTLALIEVVANTLAPRAANAGVSKVSDPAYWNIYDPELGFRPRPDTKVDASATVDGQMVYHHVYTIDRLGARRTPGSAPDGPTYLFLGDSFVFGEGLADEETLPAQFARTLQPAAHVVNLGVLGYGPNHLVRAIETGQYDRFVTGKVEAVVTWIIPAQLPRVVGEGSWLRDAPRYVMQDDGGLHYTGSFLEHRIANPLAGLSYVVRTNFAWAQRAATPALEREQEQLFVAMLARLKQLVRERYDAPLIVIDHWPEVETPDQNDLQYLPTFNAIRELGMPMISVRKMMGSSANWHKYFFAYDGHPNALLDGMLANALKQQLEH